MGLWCILNVSDFECFVTAIERGEKDKSQQDKQQFWSAAQRLMSAVKPIGAAAQGQEPKPLKNEITNLNKAKCKPQTLPSVIKLCCSVHSYS